MSEHKGDILIVDDDKFFCDIKVDLLSENGFKAEYVNSAGEVVDKLKSTHYDLVLLDLNIGKDSGIDLLPKIKRIDPDIEVIMLTGFETISTAVKAIKIGAYDYLQKSIKDDELLIKINRAIERRHDTIEIRNLKDALGKHFSFANIVGSNEQMQKIYSLVKTVCNTDVTVLIKGETGSGKELIAKAVHFNSQRKDKPFIAVNCAAISEHLMESELFGHEKGAFTGAHQQRKGKIEAANQGTLFLDEIGDMSLNLQAKLLRFLQDKTFERVGSNDKLSADVRVIAATNRDLQQMIQEAKFREDLYYRINVMHLELPALRDRMDDLAALIEFFIKRANIKFNKTVTEFSKEAIDKLRAYRWPGNVRELENVIDRLVLTSDQETIDDTAVSLYLQTQRPGSQETTPDLDLSLREARDEFEKNYLLGLLKKFHGNLKLVSEKAGMDRKAITVKMDKFGFKKEDFKVAS